MRHYSLIISFINFYPITIQLYILASLVNTVISNELVLVQVVWRHGDRTPTATYPSDPNQEDTWPQGWGELTVRGMEQQVHLGELLYDRYVNELKFLSSNYNSKEIYIRSTDKNRTISSALSNIVGMYYNRSTEKLGKDYPNKGKWPKSFIPVPVHTVLHETDHVLSPDTNCKRQDWLWSQVKKTPEFLAFHHKNQGLLDKLSIICNWTTTYENLWLVQNAVNIEKIYGLKTNIDDNIYNELTQILHQLENMQSGLNLSVYNGIDFRIEIPKIRGGGLLWTILDHATFKVNCLNASKNVDLDCRWMKNLKYYAFSAHDTTLVALMTTWGSKLRLIPYEYPSYTAAIAFELWKTVNGFEVSVLYRHNDTTNFEDVTNSINGCTQLPKGAKCKLTILQDNARKFCPGDISQLCQDVSSPSTEMCTKSSPSKIGFFMTKGNYASIWLTLIVLSLIKIGNSS